MKSMTGYGSAEGAVGRGSVFVEIKTVNHRYCDITIKIPPKMNPLESKIRNLIKSGLERGKIEFYMKERRAISDSKNLSVDTLLVKKYRNCLNELKRALNIKSASPDVLDLIDIKDFISVAEVEVDYDKYWSSLKGIVQKAVFSLNRMRQQEGAFLQRDQKMRLANVAALVEKISRQSKENWKKNKERMVKECSAPNGDVSSIIDKMDIAEELTRLASHCVQYKEYVFSRDAQGRRLDFLLQEMNREVNTLGAKACDAGISKYVVDLKSELEKMREQIQNIE